MVGTKVGTIFKNGYLYENNFGDPMAVSFKLYALERKMKKNGEVPIYLRITKNQKYRYISTGVSVLPKDWNPKSSEVRKTHRNYKTLNQQLQKFVDEANDKLHELDNSEKTLINVKEVIVERNGLNIFDYGERFAKSLEEEANLFESRQTKVMLGNLRDFMRSQNVEFGDITLKKIEAFRLYLADELANNPNTINKKIKRLRRIFKKAYREEVITTDPFSMYKSLPESKVHKTRLSKVQLDTIKDLSLKNGTLLYHVRNAFMFSFYNAGIRFGDLCRIRWKNIVDNNLIYSMSKTGTPKMIPLSTPARAIVDLYRNSKSNENEFMFPFLKGQENNPYEMDIKRLISSKNALANKVLKQLAKQAGIQANVSFHIARHSFADYARRSEISVYDISKALGHSDIKVTEKYLETLDSQSLSNSLNKLFG